MKQIKELEEIRRRKSKVFYSSNTDSRYKMEDIQGNSIENSASSVSQLALQILFVIVFSSTLFL